MCDCFIFTLFISGNCVRNSCVPRCFHSKKSYALAWGDWLCLESGLGGQCASFILDNLVARIEILIV